MRTLEDTVPDHAPQRRVFCNRTLNLRAIRAFGYDMDYTLVHYHVHEWERCAYEHLKGRLLARQWPVDDLAFDPELFVRGLVIDRELGNLVKANRFGYVKRAAHGTGMLEFDRQRKVYSRVLGDLSDDRWVFLNTLFSQSEACMYAQLVELLDDGRLPGVLGYSDLYRRVKGDLDQAHLEGMLKAEIVAEPQRFVDLDPELPLALLDQRDAGKALLLVTNSDWSYTQAMMTYAFDRFLPKGMNWRDLFSVVIVSARKPDFFTGRMPLFELARKDGLLRQCNEGIRAGNVYVGGDARIVEDYLGVSGEEILYVGDHIFSDVHVSKNVLRWRTALVLRELEDEIRANQGFSTDQEEIEERMEEKEALEFRQAHARLLLQRQRTGHGTGQAPSQQKLDETLADLKARLNEIDTAITPLARASSEVLNQYWGPLMRAGNDKSHLAEQVERYADIYTSRVSNFLHVTPFAYLRSPRGTMPHDVVR